MSDIGFDWIDVLLLGPLIVPWLAVPAALVAGWLAYRKARRLSVGIAGAFVGLFAGPAVLFALWFVLGQMHTLGDGSARLTALVLGALAAAALILWVVHLAGARARRLGR
jgi:hypothetical protein